MFQCGCATGSICRRDFPRTHGGITGTVGYRHNGGDPIGRELASRWRSYSSDFGRVPLSSIPANEWAAAGALRELSSWAWKHAKPHGERAARKCWFVRLTDLSLSRGEAPCASGRAARRLPQLTSKRRAASASDVTPCVSGGKRGFSPGPTNGPPLAAVRSSMKAIVKGGSPLC